MTTFLNNVVNAEHLPQVHTIELQPVEPAYRKVILWTWGLGWGIVLAGGMAAVALIPAIQTLLWALLVFGGILLFAFLNLWLWLKSFSQKAYAVRERDLIYRSGWLIQNTSVCPFGRVQHCSVTIGPFERKLGLASLALYTAGTDSSDIKVPGLKQDTAEMLRDFIMQKTGKDEPAGN